MLMYLFFFNWMFSMMFIFMNHPLSLGCILMLQTIIIALISGFMYYNFWFSYILFLIMVGGMLVMFMYMTSIASNEKFKMPNKMILFNMACFITLIMMIIFMDTFMSNIFLTMINNLSQSLTLNNMTLNKFFCYPNMQMLIFLMIYLLITLIAVVKIVGKNYGTLRQK